MRVNAQHKNARISAQKARLVADLIRGKDVAPYTIVGGNPAKPIRRRFTDEQIAMLQAMQWWNWPLPRLQAAMPLLCSGDIPALYQHWQQEYAS